MVFSVSEKSHRVLLLVEGPKEEGPVFKSLAEKFDLPFDIVVYGTNIYDLYRRIRDDADGEGTSFLNLRDVLLERISRRVENLKGSLVNEGHEVSCDIDARRRELAELENDAKMLEHDFAYTYLIYDCDIQHHNPRGQAPSIDQSLDENLPVLKAMLEYFDDETDETVGKLYINYPMMESWRDANDVFDPDYQKALVSLDDLKLYKQLAGGKLLAGRKGSLIALGQNEEEREKSKRQFEQILRMMVFKLSHLHSGIWGGVDYRTYGLLSNGLNILDKEAALMRQQRIISVINTSLFAVMDYRGNMNGDFDRIMGETENAAV